MSKSDKNTTPNTNTAPERLIQRPNGDFVKNGYQPSRQEVQQPAPPPKKP
ncbi:hypothetical protein ABMZ83_12780 [Morganella morganii]